MEGIEIFKGEKRFIITLSILMIMGLTIIGISSTSTLQAFSQSNKKLPIYSVATKEKKIAITFDTTWGEDNMDEILNVLDKYNAKATFYVVGLWIDDFPEEVKEIDKRGHELGNHSNKHPNMTTISEEKIIKELDITDAKLLDITDKTSKTFRFPEGAFNDAALDIVEKTGRKCIQWDVDSIDWKGEGSEIEAERVLKKVKEGSIVLFHNARYTPQSLTIVLEKLSKEGYEFVTITDLIYDDEYKIDGNGRQIKNK
ncbi:polysaccharide deacetylase family protein [Clostridium sp. ATCC 25772]|uniref:Polysaccharide deacetylase family protein n=1 Tax=Clostridium senegalense TaxID=1465809 RepID=A0A6M0H8X6_9CLOT|nr:polysaccharide deacetylase family protein [Clostridium sp. ATCC 25772]NEU06311.1 polysaccharide deacetylase family protein [Clostridium senegalense]